MRVLWHNKCMKLVGTGARDRGCGVLGACQGEGQNARTKGTTKTVKSMHLLSHIILVELVGGDVPLLHEEFNESLAVVSHFGFHRITLMEVTLLVFHVLLLVRVCRRAS